jgi:uncharacterized Rossmann fold enzyme
MSALMAYGRSRPPRSRGRRLAWGLGAFAVIALVLPLTVVGAVQAWTTGDRAALIALSWLSVLLLLYLGWAVVGLITFAREGRGAHRRARLARVKAAVARTYVGDLRSFERETDRWERVEWGERS